MKLRIDYIKRFVLLAFVAYHATTATVLVLEHHWNVDIKNYYKPVKQEARRDFASTAASIQRKYLLVTKQTRFFPDIDAESIFSGECDENVLARSSQEEYVAHTERSQRTSGRAPPQVFFEVSSY